MEPWLIRIADYLLAQSWQIAILTVLVVLASLLLRNRSAHVRYLLWLIVLAKALVPPLYSVPLAVLPEEESPTVLSMPLTAEKGAGEYRIPEVTVAESPRPVAPELQAASSPAVSMKPARYDIRTGLAIGWLTGVIVLSLYYLFNALRTQIWLQKRRKVIPSESIRPIENFFTTHGVRRKPRVWLLERINQPFVWGLVRGSIYLPVRLLDGKHAKFQPSLLGHELSHVMRFDAMVNSLQVVAQTMFWFHPFVWWANRKIRAEREKCCDEMTIARLNARPEEYGEAIIETLAAKYDQARPVPSLAVAGQIKNIEERIKTMLRPGKKFYKRPTLAVAIVALVIALLTVPTALVLTARAGTEGISTPLHQAVNAGDIERVKSLLSKGVDVNAKDEQGQTALHVAGRLDITLLLVANGADLDARDKQRRTALFYAAMTHGRIGVLQQLLALGADPNIVDASGETPLHHAVKVGAPGGWSIVSELVAKGADINAKNNDGRTPAHVKAARRKGVRLDELIKLGADLVAKDNDGNTVLHLAIEHARPEEKESILAYDVNVNQANTKGQTPLHIASQMGHKKVVEGLIAKGAHVDASDFKGRTALHIAAVNGYIDIATILLDKGANVNMKTKQGHTPVYLAVRSLNYMVANQLVKRGADMSNICMASYMGDFPGVKNSIARGISVNTKDEEGFAPLHAAAAGGRKVVVEFLLSQGAEPKEQVQGGWTALAYAAVGNHTETLELLRAKGIDAGSGVSKLLPIVAGRGDIDAAKCIIALGADVNVNNGAPLRNATRAGHKDMVELLIAGKANVNLPEDWPPLHIAVDIDRPDIAGCLIAAGADVNAGGWTALMEVPYTCKGTEMAELLIKAGADINKESENRWTALHAALDNKSREDIVRLLLSNGANPNARGWGWTPLHEAAWYRPNAIKILVDNGADVNARGAGDWTPIHYAYYYALRDSVRQLVALGADINARTDSGETILHLAPTRYKGASASADFIEFLLAQGADLNARDNSGWTPLHRAALLGKSEMVSVLLAHGADADAQTNDGKTPSGLAKESRHTEIVQLLEKHGAEE
jgi:cytohesin